MMAIIAVLEHPTAEQLPLGKPALVEIATKFWSDDWCSGLRSRTYLGDLCHHAGGGGMVCVQPQQHQGRGEAECIPFDPALAKITVLTGRLGDYT